jgi:catechol 2,3-dioxygenase-like lactoylglutathione lyase family enzyme
MKESSMMYVATLHHVSLPVTDIEKSMEFYKDTLCLHEIERPKDFKEGANSFLGAWYQVGAGQLHLIVPKENQKPTFRTSTEIDSRDVHLAVRVSSFKEALQHLKSKGYIEDTNMKVSRHAPGVRAGFPQIYILDPDRHIIEINAERLD